MLEYLNIKLQTSMQRYYKETPAQTFSANIAKKNSFLYRIPPLAASDICFS